MAIVKGHMVIFSCWIFYVQDPTLVMDTIKDMVLSGDQGVQVSCFTYPSRAS
jgi:hypothetical protein